MTISSYTGDNNAACNNEAPTASRTHSYYAVLVFLHFGMHRRSEQKQGQQQQQHNNACQ